MPNHRMKSGASATRGSAFSAVMKGASSILSGLTPARRTPAAIPVTLPSRNASSVSLTVVQTGVANSPDDTYCSRKAPIASGVLKKKLEMRPTVDRHLPRDQYHAEGREPAPATPARTAAFSAGTRVLGRRLSEQWLHRTLIAMRRRVSTRDQAR